MKGTTKRYAEYLERVLLHSEKSPRERFRYSKTVSVVTGSATGP